MLYRIVEGEEIASRFFETVAQRDQFLPTIDRNQPSVFEVALELLGFNAKIDNVRVGPNERMERLHVGGCRSILFAPINFHRAGLVERNGDNPRHRIGAEEQCVFLKFHPQINFLSFRAKSRNLLRHIQTCLDFARHDKTMKSAKSVDINPE
jgi:hypothetical protein